MSAIIITGLPGTGKTHLAIALGASLMDAGQATLLLHTDILKVTLRQTYPNELKGAGYTGDFARKAQFTYQFLQEQVDKADRDDYCLIVEGTLALGFFPAHALSIFLELPEQERLKRIQLKHSSAKQALTNLSLETYQTALEQKITSKTLRLNAQLPISTLVQTILLKLVR
jgi:hypothetical protein